MPWSPRWASTDWTPGKSTPAWCCGSDVVVEGRASALREAGDLIPARSAEEWEAIRPANLRDLVKGEFERSPGKPCLYAGVGMAWEDLVTAAVVYERGTRS